MTSYLDKEGLSTFLDCLREEELAPIQNDVSNLQQTKADNETVVNGLASVAKQGENAEATNSKILEGINKILSRSAVYNTSTGDLTLENVDIIIE
jgi:hypothetical protein